MFLSQHSHDFSATGQDQLASLEALASLGIDIVVGIIHSGQGQSDEISYLELLVQAGCPASIRSKAWRAFLDISVRKMRNYYHDLVHQVLGELQGRGPGPLSQEEIQQQVALTVATFDGCVSEDITVGDGDSFAPNSPELNNVGAASVNTCPSWITHGRVWLQQIEKDLPRTFPAHYMGTQSLQVGVKLQAALRRILAAYALRNPTVGYCQGLNVLAGCLLMSGLDEEDAFYCLCTLVEDMLSGNYSSDMLATKVDTKVFRHLVQAEFPLVMRHLDSLGVDISCVFVQWFLCVFVNFLPHETCLRVWDLFLYQRSSAVLFQVSLALVEIYSPALLATCDEVDAFQVLQSMAPLTYDGSRLISTACQSFKDINDKMLTALRDQYRQSLQEEEEIAGGRHSESDQKTHNVESNKSSSSTTMSMMKKLFQRLEKSAAEVSSRVMTPSPPPHASNSSPDLTHDSESSLQPATSANVVTFHLGDEEARQQGHDVTASSEIGGIAPGEGTITGHASPKLSSETSQPGVAPSTEPQGKSALTAAMMAAAAAVSKTRHSGSSVISSSAPVDIAQSILSQSSQMAIPTGGSRNGSQSTSEGQMVNSSDIFPQAHQEFIALSPSDGATIPDIDDLLFVQPGRNKQNQAPNLLIGMREKKKLQMISQDLWDKEDPKAEVQESQTSSATAITHDLHSTILPSSQDVDPSTAEGAHSTAAHANVTSASAAIAAPAAHRHRAPELRSSAAALALTIAKSPWNLTTTPSSAGSSLGPTGVDYVNTGLPQAVSNVTTTMTCVSASINQPSGNDANQDYQDQQLVHANHPVLVESIPHSSKANSSSRDDWMATGSRDDWVNIAYPGKSNLSTLVSAELEDVIAKPHPSEALCTANEDVDVDDERKVSGMEPSDTATVADMPMSPSSTALSQAIAHDIASTADAVEALSEQLGISEILRHHNILQNQAKDLKECEGMRCAQEAVQKLSDLQLRVAAVGSSRHISTEDRSPTKSGDMSHSSSNIGALSPDRTSPSQAASLQLQNLLVSLLDLQRHVRGCEEFQQQEMAVLEQYQVVCEVMSGQLKDVVSNLVERNNMIDAMFKKQNELLAKLASQDDEIVELKWSRKNKALESDGKDSKPWAKMSQMFKKLQE
ncbi:hypothetical protein CEUSTIGMA_g4338.t1 [Chlamydomonas eustigma]|uniref:Rab-GAP TBC domain-containing protein n=1 Tax=Chlamydomonas eustigma TaxID=1157962 RepID=A0A250X1X4_9CHLO|nr:hypothetical protein CEUSTIGMA_g4338.t1 [Chlamydomonas eustigma]|eukprot:GAX76892.1 hypothetical protein CEUSTIGMA_g4338.t1 [Chlamydomonas eustigma]